jgi:hypothetical protein
LWLLSDKTMADPPSTLTRFRANWKKGALFITIRGLYNEAETKRYPPYKFKFDIPDDMKFEQLKEWVLESQLKVEEPRESHVYIDFRFGMLICAAWINTVFQI